MRLARILTFSLAVLAGAALRPGAGAPVPLIFDTDMGNDVDDVLALGLIHGLQNHDKCKLLAVTLSKDNRYAAPFVDLVNTFYGRGDVPVGVVRDGKTPDDGNFLRALATAQDNGHARYPHKLRDGHDAPEATALLLYGGAGPHDGSVVIVQVGFSTNLARLLDSTPDGVSPLSGEALVRRKVRLLSVMAGNFAPGAKADRFREYNVATDVGAAQKVFHSWPTPIVFSGFEVGDAIRYPSRSIVQDYAYVPHHPLAAAYKLYGKMPYDRPTWDLTSVLYAVYPDKNFFGLSAQGRVVVADDGTTRFQVQPDGPHRYLTVTPEQTARARDAFAGLCSERPRGMLEREKQWAEAARKIKVRSTRSQPEARVALENDSLRLDFDPRASDTAYNYLWLRRPRTDRWERVYNFGVDVHAPEANDQRDINCVGLGLSLRREGQAIRVAYPRPLIQYRQFDEKIGTAELLRKYPDLSADDKRGLVHADAAIEFRYELDPGRPSFVVSGKVTQGRVNLAIYIVNGLWTDNRAQPTHECIEGRPEYDIARPEAAACREAQIEKVRYIIFYRQDGEGVPFAMLPLSPERASVSNFYDNWKCLYDFRASALNQQFIPEDPPITGSNDVGYNATPRADGTIAAVRFVFFPELSWKQGGKGAALRERIIMAIAPYLAGQTWGRREGKN
jgi:inosine-uridine nucleoside N-ribohydrolase